MIGKIFFCFRSLNDNELNLLDNPEPVLDLIKGKCPKEGVLAPK